MNLRKIIINILFGSVFFNHLFALSFIPQHNRPLLLLLFPMVLFFIIKFKVRFNVNLIFSILIFHLIVIVSFLYNLFFGDINFYLPEIFLRISGYLVMFYFFLIGLIFYENRKLISYKYYYFFILVGFIQVYTVFGLPFSGPIINLFDNYLIDSYSTISDRLLFFEAEPSYVVFCVIFLMVMFEKKNSFLWMFFSVFTLSLRTTLIIVIYFFKKHVIIYSLIAVSSLSFFLSTNDITYTVFNRVKAILTFQQLDPSSYIRVVNNKIALEIIRDYPVFGVGPGQYSVYFSHKYLINYDTRGISELNNAIEDKTKTSDPYSFIIGMCSELGIFVIFWIILTAAFFYYKTKRKFLFSILLMILLWGYPYGKPYIWLLLGYIYKEFDNDTINQQIIV